MQRLFRIMRRFTARIYSREEFTVDHIEQRHEFATMINSRFEYDFSHFPSRVWMWDPMPVAKISKWDVEKLVYNVVDVFGINHRFDDPSSIQTLSIAVNYPSASWRCSVSKLFGYRIGKPTLTLV